MDNNSVTRGLALAKEATKYSSSIDFETPKTAWGLEDMATESHGLLLI
jgi:hypothetical protein